MWRSCAAPPVTYAYDLAGRLTSLEASGAVATFTSDAAGARTGVSLPNGALTSFGYDAAGRIESIVTTAASGVIAESYTRDAAGRVTADSAGDYAYDDAGRLITWTAPDDTVTTYTYDAASNLTGASVDGSATASFAYDAADRITNDGFTYDDAGNLTSDGERTFTYDAACRLVAVADASTEATIATYTYDAFNRRTSEIAVVALTVVAVAIIVYGSHEAREAKESQLEDQEALQAAVARGEVPEEELVEQKLANCAANAEATGELAAGPATAAAAVAGASSPESFVHSALAQMLWQWEENQQ